MRTPDTDRSLQLLSSANPVTPERARGLLSNAQAAAALERIAADPPASRMRVARRRLPALAAATAASGLVAWAILAGSGEQAQRFPALEQAAAAAQALPPPALAAGSVRYERWSAADLVTVADRDDRFSALVERRVESWADPSGRALIRAQPGRPRFLGPADEAAWRAAGSPPLSASRVSETEVGASIADLERLTDRAGEPSRLLDAVRAQGGSPIGADSAQSLVRIGDLLRDPTASPELRAGLYRALALVPGMELDASAIDPLGREGVSFGVVSAGSGARTQTRLVFDPRTSRLLAEETVLLEPVGWLDATPPVSIGWRAVVSQGLTDRTGQRPPEVARRRSGDDREARRHPRIEAARQLDRARAAQVAQGRDGQARPVALLAHHDQRPRGGHDRRVAVAGVGRGPPLQDVPRHHERPGHGAVAQAIGGVADIEDEAAVRGGVA